MIPVNTIQKEIFDVFYSHLGQVKTISSIASTNVNSLNWLITLDNTDKFLLRQYSSQDESVIRASLESMKFCHDNKIPTPEVVLTKNDNLFENHNNHLYACFSFVEHEEFKASNEEIISTAKCLAQLHQVLKDFESEHIKEDSDEYQLLSQKEIQEMRFKLKTDTKSTFLDLVRDNIDWIEKKINEIMSENATLSNKNLTKQLIHGDFHKDNVLFLNQKVAAIIDFDSLKISHRAKEVGFACLRFAQLGASANIQEKVNLFLENYNLINPLSEEEIQHLKHFSIKESLRRTSKILRKHFLEGSDIWSFDLEKHLKNIKLAELHLD